MLTSPRAARIELAASAGVPKARHHLKSSAPQFSLLLDDIDEFVAHVALELSDQKIPASNDNNYIVFLLV